MAMIACGECGTEISTTAKACPKCGAVVPHAKIWPWVVGIPVALVIAFLLYGFSIPEYKAKAMEVRRVCEKIAAPGQQYVCDQQYQQAIEDGLAKSRK